MIHEVWWLWNKKRKVLTNVKVSSKKAVKTKRTMGGWGKRRIRKKGKRKNRKRMKERKEKNKEKGKVTGKGKKETSRKLRRNLIDWKTGKE